MSKKNYFRFFMQAAHLQWMKALLIICNAAGLVIYLLIHLAFFDIPFEPVYEAKMLLQLLSVASSFAVIICGIMILADFTDLLLRKKQPVPIALLKPVSLSLLALVILLSACNGQSRLLKGIKKDATTGLSTSYTNMEPETAMLVMNGEVLHHTDIPLGESFLLVNDQVKGLTVKNGKVAVGCSLAIADKKGTLLLQEKDLFAGHELFAEKDAKLLKCTISTGAPMQWEEKYTVICYILG